MSNSAMLNNKEDISGLHEKIHDNSVHKTQLQDITQLAAELKHLMVRHNDVLREEGVSSEMQQLEDWLETQRKGPVPAVVISMSGMSWLVSLRDRLKLSADEALRLEGEGGNPSNKEQAEKIADLLKTIRRIDKVINESNICVPN